jgi:L-amino acid N-acyltransferase YncA
MEPRQHEQLAPIIRSARRADAQRMAEVYVAAWRDAYPILLPPQTLVGMSVERWARQFAWAITRGREVVLVAEDRQDGVIGLATGGPSGDRGLAIAGTRVGGEVFSLYVSQDHLGRGAGGGLLRSMLGRFSESGFPSAVAWMLKGNPSRFFYERMGAHLVAQKRERRFGRVIELEAYGWSSLEAFSPRGAR